MSDTAGIVLVSFVSHSREDCLDLAGLHADDLVACSCQAIAQILGQSAGLKAHCGDLEAERSEIR